MLAANAADRAQLHFTWGRKGSLPVPAARTCYHQQRFRARSQPNYYDVLGISETATAAEVKEAYRGLAKALHPDVNRAPNAHEAFLRLKRAYEVLSQELLRAEHDSLLGLESARARDPRFARFERWRREVVPDLQLQLGVWSQEIHLILSEAEGRIQQLLAQAKSLGSEPQAPGTTRAPAATAVGPAAAAAAAAGSQFGAAASGPQGIQGEGLASTEWPAGQPAATDQQQQQQQPPGSSRQELAAAAEAVAGAIDEMVARVQRQYDKRYEQVQTRYPAYPDLVWYDVWEEVSEGWLAAAAQRARYWKQLLSELHREEGPGS